jgi:hypothetical protein
VSDGPCSVAEQAAAGSTGTVTSGSKRAKPPGNFESLVM